MSGQSRREDILSVARALFAEQGYDSTSTREISARLGLGNAALYSYFSSKQEVLREIVRDHLERALEALRRVTYSDAPASERLKQAIETNIAGTGSNPEEAMVFLYDQRRLDLDDHGEYIAMRRDYSETFKRLIEVGISNGEFRSDLDPSLVTLAILGMCNWVPQWYRADGTMSESQIAATFAELVLGGLSSSSSSRSEVGEQQDQM